MSLKDFAKQPDAASEKEYMGEQDVKDAISQYAKMSNDQLMGELVKHISKKRQDGEMGSVKSTIEKIKPFLNAEQKARLEVIVGQIGV